MIEAVTRQDLEHNFDHHAPSSVRISQAHDAIRYKAKMFAELLLEGLEDSREKSVALTKIEEAMFWANSALARSQRWNLE